MVSLDIVDQQAFEKTLAANLAQQQAARAAQPIPQVSALSYPQAAPTVPPYPAQPSAVQPPAHQRSSRFGGPVQPPPSQQQPPTSYGAQQGYPSYPTDPRRGSGFQNQPAPSSSYGASAPAPPAIPRNLPPEQEALIQQVLAMTPAQIAALPPEQRDMLMQVRQSVLGSR
ncbi:hypothetical protein M407DRAFT_28794 [Tulasnella calospora MUT 4182]|uniref:Transcription termination and cleavage factor C-terminal domain-containing protein n=1 Tax=Tulasnella calospora MUT 4182 TaxID=1051891 RepID=A0A0C3QBD7_9AGAM|nr:hypothetical protein M407DRAFT_28794 [Tulasnella calospora MUT 4182]